MLFNSVSYVFFLALFTLAYWSLSGRLRVWLILFSSCVFYGFWKPEYLLIMFLSSSIDYFLAKKIQDTDILKYKKFYLFVGILVNLSFLIYFKYTYFFLNSGAAIIGFFGLQLPVPELGIILPLAISFYTFEAISYLIDVYRGVFPAIRSYVHYSCFITFFPKLVAGPVLRAAEIVPQFISTPSFNPRFVSEGFEKILLGLFLKVVLADNIAPIVDGIYATDPSRMSGVDVLVAAFLFGFQIYFDFAGYSLIAIGSAILAGIRIPDNFNFPYISESPREFWKKWHISLSSWIRDYLYIAIQGVSHDKVSSARNALDIVIADRRWLISAASLFITWIIMGLWHGANWTFALWGIYHASLILIYRFFSRFRSILPPFAIRLLGLPITLTAIMLGWIPFRAQDVGDAIEMWGRLLHFDGFFNLGLRENYYLISFLILCSMFLMYQIRYLIFVNGSPYSPALRMLRVIIFGFIFVVVFVFFRPINQFIYFQF